MFLQISTALKVNVNGVPVQGLINRRQKEADYYFSVDNSVCTPVESCS